MLFDLLQELYKYRELLYMITYRDIKVRYKQSVMGFLWAILMPVLILGVRIMVRYGYAMVALASRSRRPISQVWPLNLFPGPSLSPAFGLHATVSAAIIRLLQRSISKEIFPIAAVLACLFDFFVAFASLVCSWPSCTSAGAFLWFGFPF